jgi:hypothetical protein
MFIAGSRELNEADYLIRRGAPVMKAVISAAWDTSVMISNNPTMRANPGNFICPSVIESENTESNFWNT